MDAMQDWVVDILAQNNIPIPPALRNNTTYSFILPYLYKAYTILLSLNKTLFSLLSEKPDLATLALLLIMLFISLKVLNMLANTVLWWFRVFKSLLFWGGLGVLGVWMWQRGPDGVVEDVGGFWGTWSSEYRYWKDREEVARRVNVEGLGRGGQRWW